MTRMLAIDIGNTNVTVGLFRGRKLIRKKKMPAKAYAAHERGFRRLRGRGEDICDVIISNVEPLVLARVVCCLNKIGRFNIIILGRDKTVPIKNLYRNKKEVGQDRLVNAVAARELYGAPAVIIDFGTAVTFDVVSRKGEYLGGLILPGIEMSLTNLYKKTALLPRVELKPAKNIIGKDTVNSIRGGILFGLGATCDGLVAQYKKILGKDVKVIATGGNARLIKRYAKSIRVIDNDLTLKGLNLTNPTA